ncbi:hypothetical protein REPUB_Repub10bG0039700 [Reevesia pubescens]
MEKALELLYPLSALDGSGELTKEGRMMAGFPLDPMLSKMIIVSEKYHCSDEIITVAAMLSVENAIFYGPNMQLSLEDSSLMQFHSRNVGDHIALLRVNSYWKEAGFSSNWCHANFVQSNSMKRARKGLLKKVGIELKSNPKDL